MALPVAAPGLATAMTGGSCRASIASAEGLVTRVSEARLELEGQGDVTLRFKLPREVDLTSLEGQRVRVTVREQAAGASAKTQLLTIAGGDGGVRLIAHHGPALGITHALGTLDVTAALSHRSGGPLVFGTPNLKCAVNAGEHVRLRVDDGEYVMYFVARSPADAATYAIAHTTLWRAAPR